MWEQWDTIVYPNGIATDYGVRVVRDGSGSRVVGFISHLLPSDGLEKTNRQITDNPEDQELVVARCLGIYLHSYKRKLQTCDIVFASHGISQMVHDIEQIFNQLQHRLIGHESKTANLAYSKRDWSSQKLISVCF